jgi:hypothetical protein
VKMRWVGSIVALALVAMAFQFLPVAGQAPGGPFRPPRMADGHPNLQGIWQALNTAVWDIQDHSASLGIPAGQGVVEGDDLPYLPAALAKRDENRKNRLTADPESKCFMVGVPRIMYMPYPFQILQTPKELMIVSEYVHTSRQIYMDSQHPPAGIEWYQGDSRGHWEGDTLVVDVVAFTDQTWFDRSGNYNSEALHVIERYTLVGPDHLLYEATIEDPKVFSRPWKMSMPLYRRVEKNAQILEYECFAYLPEPKVQTTTRR